MHPGGGLGARRHTSGSQGVGSSLVGRDAALNQVKAEYDLGIACRQRAQLNKQLGRGARRSGECAELFRSGGGGVRGDGCGASRDGFGYENLVELPENRCRESQLASINHKQPHTAKATECLIDSRGLLGFLDFSNFSNPDR